MVESLADANKRLSASKRHPLVAAIRMREAITNGRATSLAKQNQKMDAISRMEDKAERQARREGMMAGEKAKDVVKSGAKGFARSVPSPLITMATVPGSLMLSEAAANGGRPEDVVQRLTDRLVDNPGSFIIPALFPFGAKGMAKRQASPTGKFGRGITNMQASRANAIMNANDRSGEMDTEEDMTEDDMMKALRLKLGEANG